MPQDWFAEQEADWFAEQEKQFNQQQQASKPWWQTAYEWANKSPEFIMEPARKFATAITDPRFGESAFNPLRGSPIDPYVRGFVGGIAEPIGELFSPINVADAATGFGKGTAIRAANKGISTLTALGGIHDINQGQIGQGIAEIAGGALGFAPRGIPKSTLPFHDPGTPIYDQGRLLTGRVAEPEIPIQAGEQLALPAPPQRLALPAFGETANMSDTGFFAGQHGIADANNIFQVPTEAGVLQMKQLPNGRFVPLREVTSIDENGIPTFRNTTVEERYATPNLSRFGQVPPEVAAQRGTQFGLEQTATDPLAFDPVFGRLMPSAIRNKIVMDQPNIVSGVPFNRNPDFILEHPVGGAIVNPPPQRPGPEGQFDILRNPFTRPAPQPFSGRSSEFPNMRSGNANITTRGNIMPLKSDISILPSAKATAEAQQGNEINWLNELFNLPRALKSSMDLSAPFRQGLSLAARPEFWRSFDNMVKAWGSKDAFQAVEKSILMDKHWQLGQDSGLKLTEAFGPISKREEDFMSMLANKVPGVKQSNRAYSAFLNKLRQDTFSSLINDAEKAGLKPSENKLLTKSIAKFVNHATGRGDLKTKLPGGQEIDLERNAVLLNNMFFSPRLIKSRLHMLNPANYLQIGKEYGMNSPEAKFMRKQYLKSTIPLFTAGATMTALGAMGLGELESDPRSSDFGKLKIGNTRLDPYGGHQQYATLLARTLMGQSKSATTGNVFNLGESPVKPSMAELFLDFSNSPNRGFVGNKLHPTLAFAMDWAKLHNQQGYEIPPRVIELFAPMFAQDIAELAQEDPMLIPILGPLAATGMGVQTY